MSYVVFSAVEKSILSVNAPSYAAIQSALIVANTAFSRSGGTSWLERQFAGAPRGRWVGPGPRVSRTVPAGAFITRAAWVWEWNDADLATYAGGVDAANRLLKNGLMNALANVSSGWSSGVVIPWVEGINGPISWWQATGPNSATVTTTRTDFPTGLARLGADDNPVGPSNAQTTPQPNLGTLGAGAVDALKALGLAAVGIGAAWLLVSWASRMNTERRIEERVGGALAPRTLRASFPEPVRANPSEGKYIVVNASTGLVVNDYATLNDALERVREIRHGYGDESENTFHVIGPASNKTVAVIDGDGGVRMNPTPKYSEKRGWSGLHPRALYAVTDKRTGSVQVIAGNNFKAGPAVDIRIATREEAIAGGWPASSIDKGWLTEGLPGARLIRPASGPEDAGVEYPRKNPSEGFDRIQRLMRTYVHASSNGTREYVYNSALPAREYGDESDGTWSYYSRPVSAGGTGKTTRRVVRHSALVRAAS
mgnify:CR=1 FL=1